MWKIAQASVQGRGHVINNIPCQDKTFSICQNNVNAIVLADGAGSASLSHIGADGVTKNIGIYLCNNFDVLFNQSDANNVRDTLFEVVDDTIASLSKINQCEPSDLASTLLAVAVKDESYFILHLGDGVIGFYNGKDIKVASNPYNGEFANTTCFTTSNNAKSHLRLFKGNLNDITGFLMFSDGPEPILYKHNNQEITPSLLDAFNDMQLSESCEIENNLFETLNTIRNHVVDDCSIIMMAKLTSEIKTEIKPVINNLRGDNEHDNKEQNINQTEFSKPSARKTNRMENKGGTMSDDIDEDKVRKSWTVTHEEDTSIYNANVKDDTEGSIEKCSTQPNIILDTNNDSTSGRFKRDKNKEIFFKWVICILLLTIAVLSLILYLSSSK
jgi:hypothetical protein